MATAIRPFRTLQAGIESTKGTIVPATRRLIGSWEFTEEIDRYRTDYPHGINANVGGAGIDLRKASRLTVETELTAEEILWPLSLGVLGDVSPTADDDAQTWEFTPQLLAEPGIDTATIEVAETDGTTNHLAQRFGYVLCEELSLGWSLNEVATLNYTLFGRASESASPTADIEPYGNREEMKSNQLALFLDDAWSKLGDTQLTGLVRNVGWTLATPFSPKFTMDGQSDVSQTGHYFGRGYRSTLSVTCELDQNGAARIGEWRANDLVYVRLASYGTEISTGTRKEIRIDGCYRFTGQPAYSEDENNRLVAFELEDVFDADGDTTFAITVVNKESEI